MKRRRFLPPLLGLNRHWASIVRTVLWDAVIGVPLDISSPSQRATLGCIHWLKQRSYYPLIRCMDISYADSDLIWMDLGQDQFPNLTAIRLHLWDQMDINVALRNILPRLLPPSSTSANVYTKSWRLDHVSLTITGPPNPTPLASWESWFPQLCRISPSIAIHIDHSDLKCGDLASAALLGRLVRYFQPFSWRSLHLRHCTLSESTVPAGLVIQRLELIDVNLLEFSVPFARDWIASFQHLCHLTVTSDVVLSGLADVLQSSPNALCNLSYLGIYFVWHNQGHIKRILKSLRLVKGLMFLPKSADLSHDFAKYVVAHCPRLQILQLPYPSFGLQSKTTFLPESFFYALSSLTQLEYLAMVGYKLSDPALLSLAHCRRLRRLDIRGCHGNPRITLSTLHALLRVLPGMEFLGVAGLGFRPGDREMVGLRQAFPGVAWITRDLPYCLPLPYDD